MSVIVRRNGLTLLALVGMGLLALVIAQGQEWMINRDWFTYWGGGRGLLDGVNLYDPRAWSQITFGYGSTWLPNPVFIYSPPTAIFFAPLAALSIEASSVLWTALTELFIALAVIMIAQDLGWRRLKLYAPFWTVGFLFFIPVLLTLLMGQASALVLLTVTACAVLWDRGKWLQGGLVSGLAIVKPQPIILLLPLLAIWLALNRRWAGLAGMAISLGASVLGSIVLFPNFIMDWQAAAVSKVGGVAGRMPTVWGLTADLFGTSPLGAWATAILVLGIVTGSSVVALRLKKANALLITAVLSIPSLLVAPYLWTYDLIMLLIPMVVALIRLDERRYSFWVIALQPVLVALCALFFFIASALRLSDTWTGLLPVLAGLGLWFAVGPGHEMEFKVG